MISQCDHFLSLPLDLFIYKKKTGQQTMATSTISSLSLPHLGVTLVNNLVLYQCVNPTSLF